MDTLGAPAASAGAPTPGSSPLDRFIVPLQQRYQKLLDDTTPHVTARWAFTAVLALLYALRVYLIEGWYIVTYALGIYLLNLFIAFLSPRIDPAMDNDNDEEEDGPALPTKADEEFRPFIRRLPEFKFWHGTTKAIIVATVLTFFSLFNIPVFWPILVMYFFMLFAITMKRQIRHMIKYKYLPWTSGKRRYKGKDEGTKTLAK
eukprot:Opistho-2@44151